MDAKMSWASKELTNHTEDSGQGTVFLFDPEARTNLDMTINVLHLSAIFRGLQGSRIRLDDGTKLHKKVTDKYDRVATRTLTFLLVEPPHPPVGPNAPPWYVRGTVDCSLEFSRVNFDLILELPLSIKISLIFKLMLDDRIDEPLPTLSFVHKTSGVEYSLSFSWGSDEGDSSEIADLLKQSVRKHVQIIKAVKRLEKRWGSAELFSDLGEKIIAMYGDNVDREHSCPPPLLTRTEV